MYTAVVLNHFRGYPDLMDTLSDEIRYAKVLNIINNSSASNTIFLSNESVYIGTDKADKKLASLRGISETIGHRWIDFHEESLSEILNMIKLPQSGPHHIYHEGIDLTSENTTVVMGGTNTAGCLLWNSPPAAKNWVDQGYHVDFYLSMCADYQSPGLNQSDKNQMAFAGLYEYIKKYNLINKIDIYY